jgi:hypothetical protein
VSGRSLSPKLFLTLACLNSTQPDMGAGTSDIRCNEYGKKVGWGFDLNLP